MLARFFPMPLHSVILVVVWLLLNDFSAGHLVLAIILGVSIPWVAAPLSDPHARVKNHCAPCVIC